MGFFSSLGNIFSGGMLGAAVGSAIPGIGTALGAAIGGVGSGISGYAQRRASRDAWRRSSDMTWQLWNANNMYNDPAAQMRRFKAAGLNPNLIYGQMSNMPAPTFVRSEPEQVTNFLDQLRYLQGFDLQERQLGLQIMNSAANMELAKQSSIRQDRELALREDMRPLEKELMRARINAMRSQGDVSIGDLFSDILKLLGLKKTGKVGGKIIDTATERFKSSKSWWKFW